MVHDDPGTAKEAVPSVETTGVVNAMQTRSATRKNTRHRAPAATIQANVGKENKKGDTHVRRNCRTGTGDASGPVGTHARRAGGDPKAEAVVLPDFSVECPKNRKLACLDKKKYKKGYDSDEMMLFHCDYIH